MNQMLAMSQQLFPPRHLEQIYNGWTNADPIIVDSINARRQECEELLIIELLRRILNREPLPGDAKRLTMATNVNWSNKYMIAFDQNVLGTIVKELDGLSYSVKFIPVNK